MIAQDSVHLDLGGTSSGACGSGQCTRPTAEPCISFGATRPDQVVGAEILLVVEPLAVEAALMAEREAIAQIDEQRRGPSREMRHGQNELRIAVGSSARGRLDLHTKHQQPQKQRRREDRHRGSRRMRSRPRHRGVDVGDTSGLTLARPQ